MPQDSSPSCLALPKASVLKIAPYVGGNVLPSGVVREFSLASNENPFGPSPSVLKSIHETSSSDIFHYSDGAAAQLRQAIAEHFDLNVANIICGNGSEELLHMITRAYANPGDEILYNQYGFLAYRIATLCDGAIPVSVPQPDLRIDVDAMLSHVTKRTKIIFLDNPANPLGCYIPRLEVERLIETAPRHVLIVLDSAYAEYMVDDPTYSDGMAYVDRKNVIVTRTFSKAYALAGLRLGWAYGSSPIIETLNRVRAPFNVNTLTQKAGIAAVADTKWLQETRDETIRLRNWTRQQLLKRGYDVPESYCNFLLLPFKTKQIANETYHHFAKQGIILRPLKGYGLPTFLRVSIGTQEEMERFLQNLTEDSA